MRDEKPTLATPYEVTGYWWAPEAPDTKVPGRLEFDPTNGVTVDIEGRLSGSTYRDLRTWPIIHGETRTRTPCSLVMVRERSATIESTNTSSSKIVAQFCLLGCHFDTLADIDLVSAEADYSNLTAWMVRQPFKWPDLPSSGDRSYSVSYRPPPDIRFSLANRGFTLKFRCRSSLDRPSFHEVALGFGESVIIRPRQKQSLRWFLDRLSEFRNLLSLMMAEPVRFEEIRLQFGSHLFNPIRKMIKDYAILLFRQPYHDSQVRPLQPVDIPFGFGSVRKHFPKILTNWFERYDELEPVFDLFFLSVYNRHLNIEFQFLGLLQALEALHRRSVGGVYLPVDKYEEIRKHLVANIPDSVTRDHRAALQSRIKYGYEYSLRNRLLQLSKLLSHEAMDAVTDGEVLARFIGRIVDTRNYLTHYDESLKAESMSPRDMMEGNHSLTLFLTLLILREIQVPESIGLVKIRESRQFRHRTFRDLGGLP